VSEHEAHVRVTASKVAIDGELHVMATAGTERRIRVYNCYSNDCIASSIGHSEVITSIQLTPDKHHILSYVCSHSLGAHPLGPECL